MNDKGVTPSDDRDPAFTQRTLCAHLGRVGGAHAHQALDAYRTGAFEAFYVEAGISLELAMKTRLANISPYLLAPDVVKWFQHGHNFARGLTAANGLRSVSAGDALARLVAIDPAHMAGIAKNVEETIQRRDRSVHLGVFALPSEDELLSHAAAFVEAVNGLLDRDPEDFWLDLAGLASSLIAAERDAVRVRVERKLATARAHFTSLADDQRATLSENGLVYWQYHEDDEPDLVLVECPVCNNEALGSGELVDDGEPEWDPHESGPVGWSAAVATVLTRFECKVCLLELNGPDELAAAELPEKSRMSGQILRCSTSSTTTPPEVLTWFVGWCWVASRMNATSGRRAGYSSSATRRRASTSSGWISSAPKASARRSLPKLTP